MCSGQDDARIGKTAENSPPLNTRYADRIKNRRPQNVSACLMPYEKSALAELGRAAGGLEAVRLRAADRFPSERAQHQVSISASHSDRV